MKSVEALRSASGEEQSQQLQLARQRPFGSTTKESERGYDAWDEVRYTGGLLPTRYTYTGQYEPDVEQGDGEREPGQAQEMLEHCTLEIENAAPVARILLHPHRLDVRLDNS